MATDPINSNVFDHLNSDDPTEKYSCDWTNPEVRQFLRRMHIIALYGGKLIRIPKLNNGHAWQLDLLKFPGQTNEKAWTGNTPEELIDKVRTDVNEANNAITKAALKEDVIKEVTHNYRQYNLTDIRPGHGYYDKIQLRVIVGVTMIVSFLLGIISTHIKW